MNMAFDLPPRGSDPAADGAALHRVIVSLDDGSSGTGLARAILVGFGCWLAVFLVVWTLIR
jgi:hypothetical protein